MFSAFISYRRDNGGTFALLLEEKLQQLGFVVYLDHKRVHSGRFDIEIKASIDNSIDFIVIFSKNCFVQHDGIDYFFEEIKHAIKTKKTIIPVFLNDFETPDPQNIPDYINKILKYQGVKQQEPQNFDSVFLPELISYMSDSEDKRHYISQFSHRSVIASRSSIEREPLEVRWHDAVEIDICAYYSNMLINSDIIIHALERGVSIRYLVLDPECDAAREAAEFRLKRTRLSRFRQAILAAEELLEDIEDAKANEPDSDLLNGRFEMRKTTLAINTAIMIVRKKDEINNTVKVDFYTFDTDDSSRRSVMIHASDTDNYEFFCKQFEYIWNSEKTFPVTV